MTSFETIRLERDPAGVAWLTLNRPEVHNALNPTSWHQAQSHFGQSEHGAVHGHRHVAD